MAEMSVAPGSLPCPAMTPDYADDAELVYVLRNGDERAFSWLLDRYHAARHRTAWMYVATDAHADEVVQETWVAVLRGIDGFEQRSSLKTWLYRIVMNIVRMRGVKESRMIPFSSAAGVAADGAGPTFEPGRFRPPDDPEWPGHWASLPLDWEHQPESRLLAGPDARRRGIDHRLPAPGAARGADLARRRRLDVGRGLSCARVGRDQPAGVAPSGSRQRFGPPSSPTSTSSLTS